MSWEYCDNPCALCGTVQIPWRRIRSLLKTSYPNTPKPAVELPKFPNDHCSRTGSAQRYVASCGILWHPVASCGILCAKQQVIELLNPPYLRNIHDMVRSFLTSTLVTCCNPPSNISRGHQFQQAHEPKHPNESEDLRVPWFGSRWHRIQQRQVGSWAPVPGAMVGSWVVVWWCLLWPNSMKGFPHFLWGE